MKKNVLALLFLALSTLVMAACSGTPSADNSNITIKLIANPWPASELNVAVASQLLQKEYGYQVEIINLAEQNQWDALATGDADASLEVWPSGHGAAIAEYIEEKKLVENGGELGVVGGIHWYVPQYMVDQNPALATWAGYTDSAVAKQFASAESGELGTFYAGPANWTQYDQQIMDNLGIPFKVINTASEEALLAQVTSAYERQEPVLFYFYEPHVIFANYQFVRVELPPYSDDCYAKIEENGVACAYPSDLLFKIFNTELKNKAPSAHTLLQKMQYGIADQIEMLASLDQGMTTEEAAKAWIEAHPTTWEAWK